MKPRNYEQMEKEIEIAKKNNNHDQARKITAKMNSQKSRDLQASENKKQITIKNNLNTFKKILTKRLSPETLI